MPVARSVERTNAYAVLCFMLLQVLFNGSFDRFFLANASGQVMTHKARQKLKMRE
jgi:hypothetical protein